MSEDWASDPNVTPRTVLMISRQQLLAEAVGRAVAQDGEWSIKVLPRDHPGLLHLAIAAEPVVVVVDVDNDEVPGLDLLTQIAEALPAAGVLALGELDAATTSEAMARGAKGVLNYAASLGDVRDAFEAAAEGRTSVGPAALSGLLGARPGLRRVADTGPKFQLSPRELEILRAIAAGRSTRAIAADLQISVETVRKHTQNMLAKLGAHSKLEAAALAAREGLV